MKIYFINGIDIHWRLLFLVETDIVQFLIPMRFFAQYPFQLRFFITVGTEQKSPVFIVYIPKHFRFLIISSSPRQFHQDEAFILQRYSFSLKPQNFSLAFFFVCPKISKEPKIPLGNYALSRIKLQKERHTPHLYYPVLTGLSVQK